ncbi:MAG: tRNA pseudouridine(55) synthase TruB [Chloroflexota bacterium]|nr:tRNA pseudouridine(55) synthase TruB [Chloroflexota bacterium]
MLGVVNLDKPVGPTSHDMVSLVRRLTGIRRVGHAGTLDPLASGVLPVLVGQATRFSEELSGGEKRYEAVIRLGATSATDDGEGPVTLTGVAVPVDAEIERAIAGFVGTYLQRPPAFSARKVGGRAAYRAARAGEPVEPPPREVTVYGIRVGSIERGDATADVALEIHCRAGTYVRSVARGLGERLGCGGYLRALRRTEASGLSVEAARTPAALEALASDGRLAEAVQPIAPLLRLPTVDLAAEDAHRFTHGLGVANADAHGRVAVVAAGRLLGVGQASGGVLRPLKVIPESSS